ncbi:peptide-methionine (R)-S-oxide reductase MsrB [Granulicella cerasi]|uniref:Peptide methionine sulfoxide reductase MsrB n=1 Tax=Granulicella cerasi TaxID=741063 RepID=A0ABW1ZBD6_9BACT|nr:peptide-methionine (R)-S-oxide reductase MsrB [Granulicella cerasi]
MTEIPAGGPLADAAPRARVEKTDAEWRAQLTPEQYHVLREKGTERAFTGALYKVTDEGVYHCAACNAPLFKSDTKYDAGCGWPSFWDPITPDAVHYHEDTTYGMRRVEVTCATCGSHLGHVFPDGPRQTTGQRYCINSVSLGFTPSGE